MICEARSQVHVRSLPKGVEGFVQVHSVRVYIERTACNLGGSRAWFLSPTCNRRRAILYPVECRLCIGLNYASEHERKLDRLLRKAVKHRSKHGQSKGGVAVPFPRKPERMRWHTYFKERMKAEVLEVQIIEGFRSQITAQSA